MATASRHRRPQAEAQQPAAERRSAPPGSNFTRWQRRDDLRRRCRRAVGRGGDSLARLVYLWRHKPQFLVSAIDRRESADRCRRIAIEVAPRDRRAWNGGGDIDVLQRRDAVRRGFRDRRAHRLGQYKRRLVDRPERRGNEMRSLIGAGGMRGHHGPQILVATSDCQQGQYHDSQTEGGREPPRSATRRIPTNPMQPPYPHAVGGSQPHSTPGDRQDCGQICANTRCYQLLSLTYR